MRSDVLTFKFSFPIGLFGGLTVLYSEIPHERKAWERYPTLTKK